jgi:prepilin-type processing-associated H-X9-DG protein
MFLCAEELSVFNIVTRTHHQQKSASILFADGHVTARPNRNDRFTVDARDFQGLYDSFSKILSVFEQADLEP